MQYRLYTSFDCRFINWFSDSHFVLDTASFHPVALGETRLSLARGAAGRSSIKKRTQKTNINTSKTKV